MYDILNTTTCLLICGNDLDIELINARLHLSPTIVTRQGEVVLPTLEDGAARIYDSRFKLDCWRVGLTNKQHQFNIDKQLEFWIEKLYPFHSAFQEFNNLGYWSVIDCQIASQNPKFPSIQFRLKKEILLKLSKLYLDIDFTIYRPTV